MAIGEKMSHEERKEITVQPVEEKMKNNPSLALTVNGLSLPISPAQGGGKMGKGAFHKETI